MYRMTMNLMIKRLDFMDEESKLGTMPIGRLLVSMSIPMMVSFFIQALYNIVDSMFVAMISENALTAVSIAFPMQNIITAIGVGTGVGINALVPRRLGQGRQQDAEKIANVGVSLSVYYWIIFILIGLFVVRPYYSLQTGVTEIVEDGVQYLSLVCIVSVGSFFGAILEKLLVSTGHTICSMISQASGAVFNIVFDPILIFGIGPFPAMGVAGAATATVLGQILGAIVAAVFVLTRQKAVRLHVGAMFPDWQSLKEIYSVGVPSMVTTGLTSAMSFGFNQILLGFSTTATAVFGIWMKLQNFSYMPIFGMNNGTVPMISYNYGTGKMDRVNKTIHLSMAVAVILMTLLCIIFELIPGPLLSLFSAEEYMRSVGITALRLTCLSLPLGAVTLIYSSSYQSLGYSRYTLIVNLCRQLIFMIPVAWLLSLTGRLELVWWAVAIAEAMSAALSLLLRRRVIRDLAASTGRGANVKVDTRG